MDEARFATPTSRLVGELIRDIRRFLGAEMDLASAEFVEIRENVSSGLVTLAGGVALLLGGLMMILAAASAMLVRLGLPPDAASLVVGMLAIAVGLFLLRFARRAWRPERLVPERSLAQIASLLERH
jgi:hypothetical protein